MKDIINEMIDELDQELQEEYQQLHRAVLDNQYILSKNVSSKIETLRTSINTLNVLLTRIDAKETSYETEVKH